ncbi:MAG: WGxxGxxG family protein [Mycobacterium sp.]
MRKTIAVMSATGALLFGGAGVANAAVEQAPATSSTTTLADNDNTNNGQHKDNTGLWGLLGLLGLGGLAGLKRRNETHAATGVGPTTTPGTPGRGV